MRRALIETLVRLAERDRRVALLTGDLGFTVVEPFAERFPDRFVNVGVAEQNLVGLATGMADAGLVPYTYSLASFTALRPYEFIRNGPVLHRLPVRLIGVGGGFDYGVQGATHHGLEDLGVLRLLPGLTVVAPADTAQLVTAVEATAGLPGPVYLRVAKADPPPVPGLDGRFRVGRAEVLPAPGGPPDVVLIATGTAAGAAAAAAGLLRADAITASVVVAASIAPAPVADLVEALAGVPLAMTVEAHHATGGLGSLVAEVIADHGLGCRLVRQGVRLDPGGRVGSQEWFETEAGLTAEAVAAAARAHLGAGRG